MRFITSIFSLERKRLFRKRNTIVLLVFFAAALFLVHTGIGSYKKTVAANRDFQALAALKFQQMMNYTNYSLLGVEVLFVPTPLAGLFQSIGPASEWRGRVNTIATLDISINGKGSAVFKKGEPDFPLHYALIILLPGTLLVLFYGFGALRRSEYLKFLSAFAPPFRVYTAIVFARITYITVCLAALSACVPLLYAVEGIPISGPGITAFLVHVAAAWLLLVFFFSVGVLIGRITAFPIALAVLLTGWFALAFILPGAVTSITKKNVENITSSSKVELEQLKIIVDFENNAKKNHGKFNRQSIETGKKIMEGYWNDGLKKVEAIENALKAEIAGHISDYEAFSIFIPVTFYRLVCNEAGGGGFGGYLDFYGYLQVLKRNFVRFYIDRCFESTPPVMENFIKGDENLFPARHHVPRIFKAGVAVTLGYIFIILWVSFLFFKKSLYRLDPEAAASRESSDIELNDHAVNVCLVEDDSFRDFLYVLFSGGVDIIHRAGYNGKVWLDEVNLLENKERQDFTYIPHARAFPGDIRVRELVTLVCELTGAGRAAGKNLLDSPPLKSTARRSFGKLKPAEAFQVLLALLPLKKSRYFILDHIAAGLPAEYAGQLKDQMDELNARDGGGVVVYLTAPGLVPAGSVGKGKWFDDGEEWSFQVDAHRRKQKPKK
ncbi:MAG: hypothetical protein GY950_05970 [bacterium]|nr:hypothetical protein [bacterium]